MRLHGAEHLADIRRRRAVAAQQAMIAEEPDIAGNRDRLLGQLRHLVGIGQAGIAVRGEGRPLRLAEADQVEVEAKNLQLAQFEPEQFLVPAAVERQLVVGDRVGLLLRLGPADRHHDRDFGDAQLARRQHPAMTGDDACRPRRPAPDWSSPIP